MRMAKETLYDHNPTEAELKELFRIAPNRQLQESCYDQDSWYGYIYSLYEIRNDHKTALTFLNKIKDKEYRIGISSRCLV
jgi:hypothetical protein